jgi:hypothetical protein
VSVREWTNVSLSSGKQLMLAIGWLDKMGETFLDAREVLRVHAEGSDHEAIRQ